MKAMTPPPRAVMGRQSCVRFSRQVAETICERIAQGESWSRISADEDMPSYTTLYSWLKKYPEFAELYMSARQALADRKFDDAWEIADAVPGEGVPQAKLKIDTLRWQTTRLAPKTYGDRAAEGGGRDDRKVILNIQVVRFGDDDKSEAS